MVDNVAVAVALILIILLVNFLRKNSQARVKDIKAYAEMNRGVPFHYDKGLVFIESIRTDAVSIRLGYQFDESVKVYIAGVCPGGSGGEFYQTVVESSCIDKCVGESEIFSPAKLLPIYVNRTLFREEFEYNEWVRYSNKKNREIVLSDSVICLLRKGYTVATLNGRFCIYQPRKILSLAQISEIQDVLNK